ncbi:metal ABC transporter permease [Arcanobacterium ihumii]|uniref:metal ABC transporter permease n=1 Tax=Arcanobacterium ihumii TaxID=2138162 RepID=UPI00190F50FA|nr:metal ABC transporter permease [Arcanobacterium ihumii]
MTQLINPSFDLDSLLEMWRTWLAQLPGFAPFTDAPFLFRPFLLLLVLGISAGLTSVIVNLRCLEFNSEATVHSIFPGIVAGALIGGIDSITTGALVAAVFVVIAITWNQISSGDSNEAGTAIVLTSFFGFGMLISLRFGDMSGQLEALMFGRLLEVTSATLIPAVLAATLAGILIVTSWRNQVFVAFDRTAAQASGKRIGRLDLLANTSIALIVIAGSAAIGTLLVIGFLIVPGATARLISSSPRQMGFVSVLVAVASGVLGMEIMYWAEDYPVSPQGTVALSGIVIFALVWLGKHIFTDTPQRNSVRASKETISHV